MSRVFSPETLAHEWECSERMGWVYFIIDPDEDAVKIGYADDMDKRLVDLQTGNPRELILDYFVRGTRRLEKRLQKRFKHLSIRREWFRHDGELAGFIDDLEGLKRQHVEGLIRSGQIVVHTVKDVYHALDEATLPENAIAELEIEN